MFPSLDSAGHFSEIQQYEISSKTGSYIFAVENNLLPQNNESFDARHLLPGLLRRRTNKPLSLSQVIYYENNSRWKAFRCISFSVFWALWFFALLWSLMFSLSFVCFINRHWWKNIVIYELWVPSFQAFTDSDGDGVGDLAGVAMRLSQIKKLGVDAIFLRPPIAEKDLLQDYSHLISASHKQGISVLADFPLLDDMCEPPEQIFHSNKNQLDALVQVGVEGINLGLAGNFDRCCKKLKGKNDLSDPAPLIQSARSRVDELRSQELHQNWKQMFLYGTLPHLSEKCLPDTDASVQLNAAIVSELGAVALNNKICHRDGRLAGCVSELISDVLLRCRRNSPQIYPVWQVGDVHASRVSSRVSSTARSELILMLVLLLPGSVSVLYGDELGMRDLTKGRDNPQRGTMLWNGSSPNAGFSSMTGYNWSSAMAEGTSPDFRQLNFQSQLLKKRSRLNTIRRVIQLKRKSEVLATGKTYITRPFNDTFALARYEGEWEGGQLVNNKNAPVVLIVVNFGSALVRYSLVDLPPFHAQSVAPRTAKVIAYSSNGLRFRVDQMVDLSDRSIMLGPAEGVVLSAFR